MKLALLAKAGSIHTVRWVNELAARGQEVHLITMHHEIGILHDGVHLHFLPFDPPLGYFLNVTHLRKILRSIKPDLLHVHYASGYGTLGRLTDFKPYVLSVWGSDVYAVPYRSPIHRRIVVRNLKTADHVCSTSWAMREQTYKLCQEIQNISVIPFGIDVNFFCPEPCLKDTAVLRIGTVKALTAKCGIDLLMHAFSKVRKMCEIHSLELTRKLRLLIVGDGPERGRFEALARELSIDRVVEFTGHVSHTEVPKYLRCLDIYAAMSRSESFGVAVLEASACEIPVVVSNVGGLPEVVEDGKTGCVVESENITLTAEVLLRLIEDPALRACMGKAGRQRVLDHYQWTKSVILMEEVYAQVLNRNSKNLSH